VPVISTFNLPALPPIPDQVEAATDRSNVAVPAQQAVAEMPSSKAYQAPSAASETKADEAAPAATNAATPALSEVEDITPAPAINSFAVTPSFARSEAAAPAAPTELHSSTEQASMPASAEEEVPSPEKAAHSTVDTVPLPKQGDLLAPSAPQEKPATPSAEAASPVVPAAVEHGERKSDSQG